MTDTAKKQRPKWWQIAILIPLAPLILIVAVLALLIVAAVGATLRMAIWLSWCPRGRDVLFVYSNSPVWHDYIEQYLLPRLGQRAVILNWSQRKRWPISLAQLAFHHFGGYRQFNPLAVVFRPFGRTHTFRFWQPFRDFKHGRPEALHKMEAEFFRLIGVERE